MPNQPNTNLSPWKNRLHEVIFEADTPGGKAFDVALILAIVLSVVAVMLESVESIREHWGTWFYALEWTLTILFTLEYVLRVAAVKRPGISSHGPGWYTREVDSTMTCV